MSIFPLPWPFDVLVFLFILFHFVVSICCWPYLFYSILVDTLFCLPASSFVHHLFHFCLVCQFQFIFAKWCKSENKNWKRAHTNGILVRLIITTTTTTSPIHMQTHRFYLKYWFIIYFFSFVLNLLHWKERNGELNYTNCLSNIFILSINSLFCIWLTRLLCFLFCVWRTQRKMDCETMKIVALELNSDRMFYQ